MKDYNDITDQAKLLEALPKALLPGSMTTVGHAITAQQLPANWPEMQPIPVSVLGMMKKYCEWLKQTELLTFSPEIKSGQAPVYFSDGTLSHWEFDVRETGDFVVKIDDFSEETGRFLTLACMPASINEIRAQLEFLRKVKAKTGDTDSQSSYIGLLAYDLHESAISAYVLAEICKKYRHDPSPFMPTIGQFLKDCKDLQKCYATAKDKFFNPQTDQKQQKTAEKHQRQEPTAEEIAHVEKIVSGLINRMESYPDD